MIRNIILLITAAALLAGCIQRTISVNCEPQGALVYLNDTEVGRTPLTVPFTFYGVYDVRIEKDGYQTLTTHQKAKAPWWETPGIDLLAELIPGPHRVDLQWQFALSPAEPVNEPELLNRAKELRSNLNIPPARRK